MPVKAQTPLEEYLKLPEGYPAELIKGEIVVSPSPDVKHQRIAGTIYEKLLKHKNVGEPFYEIDIHFDGENVLRPDVIFIRNENKKIIGEKWIEGAPDIVVEIVSPTSSGRDFIEKKEIYEKFGVKEYWIVDPENKVIQVFVYNEKKEKFELFSSANLEEKGKNIIKSNILENFKLNLNEIFEVREHE